MSVNLGLYYNPIGKLKWTRLNHQSIVALFSRYKHVSGLRLKNWKYFHDSCFEAMLGDNFSNDYEILYAFSLIYFLYQSEIYGTPFSLASLVACSWLQINVPVMRPGDLSSRLIANICWQLATTTNHEAFALNSATWQRIYNYLSMCDVFIWPDSTPPPPGKSSLNCPAAIWLLTKMANKNYLRSQTYSAIATFV